MAIVVAVSAMTDTRKHVVIVGGGFGGLEAAKALRRAPVRVTVIDRNNHHLFQPLLYQVASAGLSPADIALPIRGILRGQQNASVLMGHVDAISLAERTVILRDGDALEYDYLVIAAGARTNFFGHDEWGEHSVSLKTLEDAVQVRRQVLLACERAEREPDPERRKKLMTFIVIGAGPTGVELAGALSELNRRVLAADYKNIRSEDVRVVLIDMADRVLGGFDPQLSDAARRQLSALEVEVVLECSVESIQDGVVRTSKGSFEGHTVLWTAGVSPVSLPETLGIELKRGQIPVGPDCSIEGHPNVFAVGDIARFEGKDGPLPGVSPVAMQEGRFVAACIAGDLKGRPRPSFEYTDKGMMATVGRSRAVAQFGPIRTAGFFAWIIWLAVHLFYLVGFKNRVFVLLNWIWQYLAYRRGARLITFPPQDPAVYEGPREAAPSAAMEPRKAG